MEYLSDSVEQTEQIATELAKSLVPGDCIALEGDLGAGKTQFVRGLVKAFGGSGRAVSSPTYVLLHIYRMPAMTVYHLDAYRVSGAEEFESIGFSELLQQDGIVVVEWASRVKASLPEGHIVIEITATSPTERQISINRQG